MIGVPGQRPRQPARSPEGPVEEAEESDTRGARRRDRQHPCERLVAAAALRVCDGQILTNGRPSKTHRCRRLSDDREAGCPIARPAAAIRAAGSDLVRTASLWVAEVDPPNRCALGGQHGAAAAIRGGVRDIDARDVFRSQRWSAAASSRFCNSISLPRARPGAWVERILLAGHGRTRA
jgi:hypothetical protein